MAAAAAAAAAAVRKPVVETQSVFGQMFIKFMSGGHAADDDSDCDLGESGQMERNVVSKNAGVEIRRKTHAKSPCRLTFN